MIRRTLPLLLVLQLALVGCQGDDTGQAAPTTTTIAPTTTTSPDPAEEGCRLLKDEAFDAVKLLRLSQNDRIAAAARELDEAITAGATGGLVGATEEVVYACNAAGYETT
jgi:hypothetical protein